MTDSAFKCPICGGDVTVHARAYRNAGADVDDVEAVFKCVGCSRWVDYDITDVALEARDHFTALVERIEGDTDDRA